MQAHLILQHPSKTSPEGSSGTGSHNYVSAMRHQGETSSRRHVWLGLKHLGSHSSSAGHARQTEANILHWQARDLKQHTLQCITTLGCDLPLQGGSGGKRSG